MKALYSDLSMATPANYRISVVGNLEESVSKRLWGLTVHNAESDQSAGKPVATLAGQLADQAALFGILNALYNMRMPLLAIECMSIDEVKGEKDEK